MSIDVLSLAREDTHLHKEAHNEYSGPCPDTSCRCQNDGFRVRWNANAGKWVFMCRGCWDSSEYLAERDKKRGWGDAISYLRHYRHMSYKQAKALVDGQEPSEMPTPAPRKGLDWQSEEWQQQRTAEMKRYKAQMPGSMALAYARLRELTDETIAAASFGFYEDNGVPFLVIPSLNGGRIVALMRRDLRIDIGEKRWQDAKGSTKELYLADSLSRKLPTILCEDAFSALSVLQEVGKDRVNAVATCGADCCQDVRWLARLARMPLVLVAFDADKSGDENARWWLDRLPNSKRLRPFGGKDANDMLRDGWDIRQWIEDAFSEPAPEQESKVEVLICSLCGARDDGEMDFRHSDAGALYCSQECQEREQARQAHIAALDELFSMGDVS